MDHMKTNITFKIISDPIETKTLWHEFSPRKTLDDDGGFRYVFIKHLGFQLHFITGYDGDNPIGLLPLQQNTNFGISKKVLGTDKPFLEFFGGVDTDSNI